MSHSLLYIIGNTEHHGTHSQGAHRHTARGSTSLGDRLPLAGSVFYAESSDDSKQCSNNTKTDVGVKDQRNWISLVVAAANSRATVAMRSTAADHAAVAGAGGWSLWVVSTG